VIGRAVWRLVCRVFEVPLIDAAMLDGLDVAIREQAAEWGL
jgi:hypothetical protein